MKLTLQIVAGVIIAVVLLFAGFVVARVEIETHDHSDEVQQQQYCQKMKADDTINCNPDGSVKAKP